MKLINDLKQKQIKYITKTIFGNVLRVKNRKHILTKNIEFRKQIFITKSKIPVLKKIS